MIGISGKKTLNIKIISMIMAMLMLLSCIDFSFIYAEGEQECSNTLNEWYVQANWNNDSTEYNLSSSKPENLHPKLTVRYYINKALRDYKPGEISITVPGIGGIKRNSLIQAETTTTQANTEWNMTYDSSKDIYTFTNKNDIYKDQTKSGGFEMMWRLSSRDGENGYSASGYPTFSLKGDEGTESITLPEIKFSYTSERDKYNIDMTRESIKSSEFEEVAQGKNDRIWYKYTTKFNVDRKARGIYKSNYFVKVSIYDDEQKTQETNIDYTQIEVYLPSGKRTKLTKIIDPETGNEVYGFYTFTDKSDVSSDTFYLGMPREIDESGTKLDGKTIFVQSSFIALYNDETEYVIQHRDSSGEIKDENLIDDNSGGIKEYDFIYSGNNFRHEKISSYDSNHIGNTYSNRLISNELYNSKIISYELYASTSKDYNSSTAKRSKKARATDESNDKSDFNADTQFQFIQGDDRVMVELENGSIRQLEKDEYNFEYITIPKESVSHDYKVYVSDDCTKPFNSYIVYRSGKTSTSESITVQLDKNVQAFYVAIEGVTGNYNNHIYVGVNFHLDWNKEQSKPDTERINPEGKIANFSYFRMVYTNSEGKQLNYAAMDGNNYTGSFGLKLKAEDMNIYNEYLYRKSCNILLRTTVTNITSATSSADEIIQPPKDYGGGYIFNTTTSGSIKSEESGTLKKFSIYAVLQNNDMKVDENLNDIVCSDDKKLSGIVLSGSAVTVDGKSIKDFSNYVSYEVRKNSAGQTVVVANFDFTNMPLDISKLTDVRMTFPVKISQNAYEQAENHTYNVNSYTIVHDKGISKISGSSIMNDTHDIDTDGDTSEQIAYSMGIHDLESMVKEWVTSVDKFVKTYLTDDYIYSSRSENVESFAWDGTSDSDKYKYSYKLSFDVGNAISDAVFYDNIECDDRSEWFGTFLSVDTSELQHLEIKPTVYYSSEKYNTSSGEAALSDYKDTGKWTKMAQNGTVWTVPNGVNVKSIAIHIDLSELKNKQIANSILYAIINMRTPKVTDANNYNKKTYNQFSAAYEAIVGDNSVKTLSPSEITQVKLAEERPTLIIKKYDEITKNVISGAKFTIYTKDESGNYNSVSELENLEVGRTGQLVIDKGLKYEQEYYYRETTAPVGYKIDDKYYPFKFEKNENKKTIEVSNTPLTGTLNFTKKDADYSEYSDDTEKGITSLEGAEYSIYKYDGTKLFVNKVKSEDGTNIYEYSTSGAASEMVTGVNGFKIVNLPWGNYYLSETTAPNGYELNNKKISFEVQKSLAKPGENEISISSSQNDTEKTASIKLTKTDSQNGNPLKGARFNLERFNSDGEWESVSDKTNMTTNVMGELLVDNVKFGTYRFREINAPIGYELGKNPVTEAVILDPSTVGTTLKLTMQNDRKTGSATMTKYSNDGKTPLAGAKYDLYMVIGEVDSEENEESNDQPIKYALITDTNGITPPVSGLEWGKYYFIEASAPKGYKKSDEKVVFEITANDVDIRKDMTQKDVKILGSVKLTKTAADAVPGYNMGDVLPGVKFKLYTKSGVQVKASYDSENKIYSYDPNGDISEFTTGADGTIIVRNLPWDSYYFEETHALSGFSLADKVRFTVNSGNCNITQELECENKKVECSLKIEKEIDTNIEDFGTPTFLFKIKKIDGNTTSYTKSLTIKNGKSGSLILSVDPGEYLIEEIKVARYKPKSVAIVEAETTTKIYSVDTVRNTAHVTLAATDGNPETACVKFTNKLYRYDKVSHNSSATNIIAANRKLTGISAEYNGGLIPINKTDPNSTYTIPKSDVTYKILYDDGSEEEITSTDARYVGFTPDSFIVANSVNDAGNISQHNVYYKDSTTNKTYKALFDVEVAPLKVVENIKVIFRVDTENSCYFSVNDKRTSANVVYYNEDDDGNKISVSGKYITPIAIDEKYTAFGWTDADGNLIAVNEEGLKEYLKTIGKTELVLYARISPRNFVQDFDYTGSVQEFIAPVSGYYNLETWGAYGGGNESYKGGAGAYVTGKIYLEKGTKLYVYVGECPKGKQGGWNGGGTNGIPAKQYYPGGGATDIALQNAEWDSDAHLYSRLIVAGAGGASASANGVTLYQGGNAGSDSTAWAGKNGDGNDFGYGGTLSSGGKTSSGDIGRLTDGSFGKGGSDYWNGEYLGAGGGGWYGGGSGGGRDNNGAGGGGSSYAWSIEQPNKVAKPLNEYYPDSEYKPDEKYYISNVTASVRDDFDETEGNGHARITYINPYASVDFNYTGKIQTFTAPQSGVYQLETWGAQGGGSFASKTNTYPNRGLDDENVVSVEGGRGGYSTANVYLTKGQTVYIAVGSQGGEYIYRQYTLETTVKDGGYNGGGKPTFIDGHGDHHCGGGGGATHIARTLQSDGQLANYESYQEDVLVVAGGGGGSGYYQNIGSNYSHHGLGGAGGGLESQGNHDNGSTSVSTSNITGSTQTNAGTGNGIKGSFGQGAVNGCAGGGGWYGGSATFIQGGAGGSGHIGKEAIDGKSIIGTENFLAPNGTTEKGHTGNGYARITFINPCESVNFGYTGAVQTFTAPKSGTYVLETWGAQGGGSVASKTYPNSGLDNEDVVPVEGGRGGYSIVNTYLTKGQTVYLVVGGKGMEVYGHYGETNIIDGGYNGGGVASYEPEHSDIHNGGGGGATHIALTLQSDGQLANYESHKDDVLVVAGGGGGSGYYQNIQLKIYSHHGLGGAGGGLESQGNYNNDSVSHGKSTVNGSTQTDSGTGTNYWAKGSFGQGASYTTHESYGSGGGGGWYGGSSAELQGGAGGSGHIGTEAKNGKSIIGTENFLAPNGTTEKGHAGNGYARITLVK